MSVRYEAPFPPHAIVKVGGSVVAPKDAGFDVNTVRSIAKELAEFGQPVVVIHGGGSFTKGVLLEHNVDSDFLTIKQQPIVEAFIESIDKLNALILASFSDVGLRCARVITRTIFTSNNGEIINSTIDKIEELITDGITPVLSGDVLVDEIRGYYTCSGDQITSRLAMAIKPKAVLFLTDVDGVYENYPSVSNKVRPLPTADAAFLKRMDQNYKVGTGDMTNKLAQAVACTPFTEFCYILNGRIPGNLIKTLLGQLQVGTRVV